MDRLRVDGAVGLARDFGFDDLAALPGQVPDISTLIAGREGGGVRLQSLLDAVGARAYGTHVTLTSTDGRFSASVPLAAVRDAVVAYRLGNAPLPREKGGPLRFFIPNVEQCAVGGVDACANVKFLGRIRITAGAGEDTRPTTVRAHEELHRPDGDT
jgi:DMSO/TMAO reductase YedYZ molybdopterin-dependent catalytic subunit